MNTYYTHKKAKIKGYILAFIPLLLGVASLYSVYDRNRFEADEIFLLFTAVFFVVMGTLIIKKIYSSVVIKPDKIRLPNFFFKAKEHHFTDIKEIALYFYSTENLSHDNQGDKDSGLTKMAYHLILKENYDTEFKFNILLKTTENKVLNINASTFESSNEMVRSIEKTTHLKYACINRSNFASWNKGFSTDVKNRPEEKSPHSQSVLHKYTRARYIVYPPITVLFLVMVTMNLWFNWTHHNFQQLADDSRINNLFKIIPIAKKDDSDRINYADIYLTMGDSLILKDVIISEDGFFGDQADTNYYYSLYPFQNPYFFDRIVNLDDDPEPEIINRKSQYSKEYQVYDFDRLQNKFVFKPVSFYSKDYDIFIKEIRGYEQKRLSFFIIDRVAGFLFIFLFLQGLIKLFIWGRKRS